MRKLLPSLMLVFLSLCSLFLLPGCFDTPKEPVMPNWDVELNVPITEKEYKLQELLDTSKNIKIVDRGNGDNLYVLLVDDIKNTFSIQDDITIKNNFVPENLDISGSSSTDNAATNWIIYNPEPEQHLISANFKSGSITIMLNNNGLTSINYELIMPGFHKLSDNSILIKNGTLNAGEVNVPLTIPLQDYYYKELPQTYPGLSDVKKYQYQAQEGFFIIGKAIPTSGVVDVNFSSGVTNDKVSIARMSGKLKRTELPFSVRTIKTNFGNDVNNFSQVDFKSISMKMLTRTFGEMKNIKVLLDSLSIIGYKKSKTGQKYSPVPLMFNQNGSGLSEVYSLPFVAGAENQPTVFDKSNSNLIKFIQNLPQEIELRSKVVLERNSANVDSEQVISTRDSVSFVIGIEAPMEISSNDASFQDTVILDDEHELKQNDRDKIVKANKASITLNVENHIPLGAIGKATFVDQYYNPLFSVRSRAGDLVSDQLVVEPATVDNQGIPVSPSISSLTLFLEKDDIQKFKDAKYVLVELRMRSFNYNQPGTYVQIRPQDYIKVKLFGGVNYHLDPEDNNDNNGGGK